MLRGPMEYIPPVEVEVLCLRQSIPLHENEGIYVRNTKSGKVQSVIGQVKILIIMICDSQITHYNNLC